MTLPLRVDSARAPSWSRRLFTLTAGHAFPAALEADALRNVLERVAASMFLVTSDASSEDALQLIEHRFEPQGVSLVLLGTRLRAVLHTWPEHGRATLDVVALEVEDAEALVKRLTDLLPLQLDAE